MGFVCEGFGLWPVRLGVRRGAPDGFRMGYSKRIGLSLLGKRAVSALDTGRAAIRAQVGSAVSYLRLGEGKKRGR